MSVDGYNGRLLCVSDQVGEGVGFIPVLVSEDLALVSLLGPLLSWGLLPDEVKGDLGREGGVPGRGAQWGGEPLLSETGWIPFLPSAILTPLELTGGAPWIILRSFCSEDTSLLGTTIPSSSSSEM